MKIKVTIALSQEVLDKLDQKVKEKQLLCLQRNERLTNRSQLIEMMLINSLDK